MTALLMETKHMYVCLFEKEVKEETNENNTCN